MNILMVIPRFSLSNEPNYNYILPIGLGYIYSTIKKAGYNIEAINLNHLSGKTEDILNKKLNSKRFDVVCTGNNALGYAVTELILRTANNHPSKPKTILGGPIITSEPELIFNALKPAFGVIGEGEETILDLLESLNKGKDSKNVNGIIYRNSLNKTVLTPSRAPIQNLDSIPFPNYEDFGLSEQLRNISTNFIFFTNLFDNTRMYPILGSRSCPFKCTFCYHDSNYRARSIKNVMEEISFAVKKYHLNMLTIHDECFAVDQKRLLAFCDAMIKLKKEISWDLKWSCQLRVELSDKKILEHLKKAGCVMVGYGLESYSPVVLNSMKKYITPEKIKTAIQNVFDVKMALQGFFIFGDSAETKETAHETIAFWEKYCKGQVGLGFIQPYPGSEIYKRAVAKGVIKNKIDFIKNLTVWNWFNLTDKMTDSEVHELRNKILDLTGKYSYFISPLNLKKEANGKYAFTVKCPFCNEVSCYKNCEISNRFTYGFNLICRKCYMRFFVVSPIQKLAYKNYSKVRGLRDLQHRIIRLIRKKGL